jgi:hypothetical protein
VIQSPLTLLKLPVDKEERIKVLTERIAQHKSLNQQYYNNISIVSYSDIELLANERKVYFIVDKPSFQYTYIEDNQMKVKNVAVENMFFNNDFFKAVQREYRNGKLFAFYSLRENMIRGSFIDNLGDIISEDRDKRIDELLS